MSTPEVTPENVAEVLQNDRMVKVAGIDVDGQLRGKLMHKKKFLSVIQDGFGFCSIVFGWDQHDQTYFKELQISNKENGYRDLVAVPGEPGAANTLDTVDGDTAAFGSSGPADRSTSLLL